MVLLCAWVTVIGHLCGHGRTPHSRLSDSSCSLNADKVLAVALTALRLLWKPLGRVCGAL